jgi:hypothetical protein
MKRILITAVAAAAALAGSLALAAPAMATPGPLQITSQATADQIMASGGYIGKSVDIPAGDNIQLRYVDIHGQLTVEGKLSLASSTIEGNTTVSGPGAGLSLFNDPGNTFWGNVTVNNAGGYYDGSYINTGLGVYSDGQQINGGLTFTNNTGSRLSYNADPGSMTVNGRFTYSGNALPYASGLTVLGQSIIS